MENAKPQPPDLTFNLRVGRSRTEKNGEGIVICQPGLNSGNGCHSRNITQPSRNLFAVPPVEYDIIPPKSISANAKEISHSSGWIMDSTYKERWRVLVYGGF